ncbi:MAG: hypothetical protein IJX65_04125 [Alistipes sp.]|nr:hypothetical protein [Alistipes sp.]
MLLVLSEPDIFHDAPQLTPNREQRLLAGYAEPRGGRVAVGEPTANG